MASRDGLLRHPGDLVPITETRDRCLLSRILEDNFWNREPVNIASPLEHAEDNEDDNTFLSQFMYQDVFVDHTKRMGL